MRFSAIVTTRDRPRLLDRAIASLVRQSVAPDEVIVVDDGDPARSDDLRARVQRVAPGARVLRNARSPGVSGARNTGGDAARGAYLAFLDDDDQWRERYLERVAGLVAAHRLEVACTDLWYLYEGGAEAAGKTAPERLDPAAFMIENPGLIGSNLVVGRALFTELGGFEESLHAFEDMDLGLRLGARGAVRYAPLHEPLVCHHQHGGPRLSDPEALAVRRGMQRFFALHAHRMPAPVRRAYRRRWPLAAADPRDAA